MFDVVIVGWNMELTGQTFTNGNVHLAKVVRLDFSSSAQR